MGRRPKRYTSTRRSSTFSFEIKKETKSGLATIFLLVIGFLGLLSFFKLAGQLGMMYDNALAVIFGWDRLLFSVILIALGALRISQKRTLPLSATMGLVLGGVAINNLIHLFASAEKNFWEVAALGSGGGYLGIASFYLKEALGFGGAFLVLLALLFTSLLFVSSTFFHWLLGAAHWLLLGAAKGLWRMILAVKNFFTVVRAKRDPTPAFDIKPINVSSNYPLEPVETEPAVETTSAPIPFTANGLATEMPKPKKFKAPPIELPLSLLTGKAGKPTVGDIKANQYIIEKTLEHFGVEVEMGEVSIGPAVTQYTLRPAEGVRLSKITALSNDLALALSAHPIRIEAPIPGKSLVGIEVPNMKIAIVPLKEILESPEFRARHSNTTIALGRDVAGTPWVADLAKMPHLLVAGTTGSGKTVCLNSLIVSLLYQNQPDELKFLMIDPKRVELPVYNGIPHLIAPVVTEVPKAVNSLKWGLYEMDRRFDLLSRLGARDIAAYNEKSPEKLPKIVYVIDELAELMSVSPQEVEGAIIRLSQMARAVGIHLMVATQRPSVDVITGLIKANITSRLAFAVPSGTDSRTILDTTGAEKLLGRGDMLFTSSELSKPKRLQGAFLTENEIDSVVSYLKEKAGEVEYNETIITKGPDGQSSSTIFMDEGAASDPLLSEAKEVVLMAKKASASFLQRRLQIGYARAARLLDLMEERGWIGPGDGAKPRAVLMGGASDDMIGSDENEHTDFDNPNNL